MSLKEKGPSSDGATVLIDATELENPGLSTDIDRADMLRLGKQQIFRRTFGFWPAFGFTSIYIATWEYLLVSVSAGLTNGGFAGLVYEYIGTSVCYMAVVLSLAEMASMAPTAGGTYHWVSEFAPPRFQRYMSYAAGWLSALGWLTGAASGYYIMATLLESCIEVYLPNFIFTDWQFSLIMIAFIFVFVLINSYGALILPMVENVSLVGHIAGWLITVATLWATAPRNPTVDVFATVVNSGGWENVGLSCLVGTTSILFCQLGPDAAVHVAEEIRDASWVLPRCMVWGYFYNAILGFVMLVTVLYTMGDLGTALTASGPFQTAFANTGSDGLTLFLTLILALLIGSGNITAVTTTSRETWAFARDGGLPFSSFMAKASTVSRSFNAPINAIIITTLLSCVLALINLGSSAAFTIIISLNLVAFLTGYILSIGSLLYCRLTDVSLPPSKFSLGRFGVPLNIFAIAYSLLALVLSCFPVSVPVDPSSANYAPAILGGVMFIAIVSYLIHGRRRYQGPVVFVEGRRQVGTALQTDR